MRAVEAARRTNMRWHEHPVAQTFLVLAVMVGVFAVQNIYVTQLFPQSVKKQVITSSQDLTRVAAVGGCPSPVIDGIEDGHPTFDPSVAESDPFNNFAPAISGLKRASESKQKFENIIPANKIDASRIKLGTVLDDAKIELVEAMTPSSPYANQNPDRPSDGTVIRVKTKPGQVIHAPDSGRKISGSGDRYIGMVMYATADGVRFANSRNDKPTGTEGYNLYIWGINTEASVVSNYGRGQNEFKRKCFPQFKAGDKLGTAKGDYIYMALRDNGDFVSIRDVSWWDGKVTAGQAATGDTSSPTSAAPTTAPGGSTIAPTAASGAARVLSVEQTATAFSAMIEGDKTKITIKGSFYVIGPVNRNDWTNANLDIHKVLGMAFSEKSGGAKIYVKETGNEQVDLSAQLSSSTFTFYTKKISGLKSINLKIDFPYSATHGNAVTVNFKINSPSSAVTPTPTARVSTAPTATPTRTAGTPTRTPTAAAGTPTPTSSTTQQLVDYESCRPDQPCARRIRVFGIVGQASSAFTDMYKACEDPSKVNLVKITDYDTTPDLEHVKEFECRVGSGTTLDGKNFVTFTIANDNDQILITKKKLYIIIDMQSQSDYVISITIDENVDIKRDSMQDT